MDPLHRIGKSPEQLAEEREAFWRDLHPKAKFGLELSVWLISVALFVFDPLGYADSRFAVVFRGMVFLGWLSPVYRLWQWWHHEEKSISEIFR